MSITTEDRVGDVSQEYPMSRRRSKRERIAESAPAQSILLYCGQQIRQARKTRDWSLEDLARHTEISVSVLSAVERGDSGTRIDKLLKIAAALEIPFHLLFPPQTPSILGDVHQMLTRLNPKQAKLFTDFLKSLDMYPPSSLESSC